MKKKQPKPKKTAPVTVEELTALIVSVVDAYTARKAKDAAQPSVPPYVFHSFPHCPGCSCGQTYKVAWSDGSCRVVSNPA